MGKRNLEKQFDWYLPYYSQFGQDKYLNEEIFKNKENGIFVEIGAYDGVKLSNTYFFEKEKRWNGVCVEPAPFLFSQLEANRKCFCVNKCVANERKKARFLHLLGGSEYGIMEEGEYPKIRGKEHTEMLSGIVDFYDPKHMDIIEKELVELGGKKEFLDVECISINDLLKLLPTKKIDYLSVDTEGSELQILKALDFYKFDVDVISFEALYSNKEAAVFMNGKGYKLIKELGYDLIYRKIQ